VRPNEPRGTEFVIEFPARETVLLSRAAAGGEHA